MPTVSIQGTLLAGPPTCSGLGVFPEMSVQSSVALLQNPKPATVGTGVIAQTVSSPSSFVVLTGVSEDGPVTAADTLYFKSDGQVQLELTTDDGTGSGTVVNTVPIQGLYIQEFPAPNRLLGMRVKGTSRIVYFGSGPQ